MDVLLNGVELVDETKTVIEVKIAAFLTPGARFECLGCLTATSTLLEVDKLRVTFMNLNEIGVFVHELDNRLVLLFVLHVKRLDGDFGQAEKLLEHVVLLFHCSDLSNG